MNTKWWHRRAPAAWLFVILASVGCSDAPPSSGSSTNEDHDAAFEFVEVREDVWLARPTGKLMAMANHVVIVNEADILLVDSSITPTAAKALLNDLKKVTDKPVRYVVNTHHHFDHAHGNQVFPDSVEIIGHEFTRKALANGGSQMGLIFDRWVAPLESQVEALRIRASEANDASVSENLEFQEEYLRATQLVVPTAPNVWFSDTLVLERGGRQIHLLFLGKGHTGGDVVVYLPAEKVLVTGDLLTSGIPDMGDGYIGDWPITLERLKQLSFDLILPGHGEPITDLNVIGYLQAYMEDLWGQIVSNYRAGVPAAVAAGIIDMRSHATNYPRITAIGVDPDAVARGYELLSGEDWMEHL